MKDKNLKRVIWKLKLDEPADSFAARVMSQIEASPDLSLEPAMREVLKNHLATDPSAFFTAQVMSQVESKKQWVAEPVISRKVWLWVAGILVMVLSVAIFSSSNSVADPTKISLWTVSAIHAIGVYSHQTIPFLVAMSSLLLGDYFWRRRWSLSS